MSYQVAKSGLQSPPRRLSAVAAFCKAGAIAFVALVLVWLI
jgi:hypothetical protein